MTHGARALQFNGFRFRLYPRRYLAVELGISWAYWELPIGDLQRIQDPSRAFPVSGANLPENFGIPAMSYIGLVAMDPSALGIAFFWVITVLCR